MQVVEGFPEDLTVASPSARILLGGKVCEFESLTIQSELDSAMPDQVATGGGAVVASTGSVTLLPSESDEAFPYNPWDASFLSQSSTVVVEAGYGGFNAKQLTGVLDGGSGSPLSRSADFGLIDEIDKLDRPITIEPLLTVSPSLIEGDWTYRRAGLSPLYITDRILRHCGFHATPPMTTGCVVSVPAMGSAWPELGTLQAAASLDNPTASVSRVESDWGEAWADGKGVYTPNLGGLSGKLDQTFQMTFMLKTRPSASGNLLFASYWGASGIRIAVTAGRSISLQTITGGVPLTVVTLPGNQITNATTFTARVTPGGSFAIYADSGATVVGTGVVPEVLKTSALSRVEITVPFTNHPAGGFQVGFTSAQSYAYTRTAHLTRSAYYYGLHAFPAVVERNCSDLLKEQAEAELAAMWLDENGHFRWVNRDRLVSSGPIGTLTSEANLLDIPWEVPAKPMYSKVEVHSREATIVRRGRSSITVYQGSASSLESGDQDAEVIDPGADEDWFQVATPIRPPSALASEIRGGRGSYFGGILVKDGVETRWATALELGQTFTRVPGNGFRIDTQVAALGAGELVEQRLFGTEFGSYHQQNLPLLRAKAKATWGDRTHTGTSLGPARAPVLQHQVGVWIQDEGELQELANWLSSEVSSTSPILRNVPIVPDPRIQKGDVFWLEDSYAYGIRLKVLVMGISLTISAAPPLTMDQEITCRVIEASKSGVLLREHDAAWANETLSAHDLFWSGSTLSQHDADPLRHP